MYINYQPFILIIFIFSVCCWAISFTGNYKLYKYPFLNETHMYEAEVKCAGPLTLWLYVEAKMPVKVHAVRLIQVTARIT